ncbi:MAG: HNH endonuclease signature motif containing protein, partial [Acidimicrobiales bacterium]
PRTVSQRRADFLAALAGRMLSERNAEASAPIATVDVVVDAEHLARLAARGAMTVPGDVVGAGLAADAAGGRVGPDPPGGGPSGVCWADAVGTGPVPGPTLVQLLCDSWVGRIVMAGRSEPLDVGRRTRTWSAAQRRAIVARDRHCTHPGCTRGPEWCQIHHIVPWDLHGDTDVGNGTLLCLWHHTHHHLTGRHRHRRRPLVTA